MVVVLMLHFFQVELSVEDIETILDTLIYDGKVERSIVAGGASDTETGVKLYRAVTPLITSSGIMRIPCGVCPVGNNRWC